VCTRLILNRNLFDMFVLKICVYIVNDGSDSERGERGKAWRKCNEQVLMGDVCIFVSFLIFSLNQ